MPIVAEDLLAENPSRTRAGLAAGPIGQIGLVGTGRRDNVRGPDAWRPEHYGALSGCVVVRRGLVEQRGRAGSRDDWRLAGQVERAQNASDYGRLHDQRDDAEPA